MPLSDALVKAIAQEASDVAGQFLNICIRAIDYCPPADMELGEYLRALITADGDIERSDKWGFREALMRSFRRRHIFPDHVQFMTEDAVRWQSPGHSLHIPGLAFRELRFDGEPGQPASADELRAAGARARAVRDRPEARRVLPPRRPGAPLPKGVVQASPPIVQSIRVTRRAAPDGRVVFDLVGEVTQSCTVERAGELFDMNGGCTVVDRSRRATSATRSSRGSTARNATPGSRPRCADRSRGSGRSPAGGSSCRSTSCAGCMGVGRLSALGSRLWAKAFVQPIKAPARAKVETAE